MATSTNTFSDMGVQYVKEGNTFKSKQTNWDSINISATAGDAPDVTVQCSNNIQTQQATCNESDIHDHSQKAAYHGLKSAYRMISSGGKGVDNRQLKPGARIAANVGIAYLQEKGLSYDREDSFDYIGDKIIGEAGILDRFREFFKSGNGGEHITDDELEEGIDQAWFQIDEKQNHADAARTAIAVAEAYLNEKFEVE